MGDFPIPGTVISFPCSRERKRVPTPLVVFKMWQNTDFPFSTVSSQKLFQDPLVPTLANSRIEFGLEPSVASL
jgi:predicted protein tyrosine phosphatase